jgi:hypothetical protein
VIAQYLSNEKCYSDEQYLNSCLHAITAGAALLHDNVIPDNIAGWLKLSDSELEAKAHELFENPERMDIMAELEDLADLLSDSKPQAMFWGEAISGHLSSYDPYAYLISSSEVADWTVDDESYDEAPALKTRLIERDGHKIAYIKITSFVLDGTAGLVKKAIEDLTDEGATSIILDLRGNPGGQLKEGLDTIGLFIGDQEAIVPALVGQRIPSVPAELNSNPPEFLMQKSSSNSIVNLKPVVLVNENTASAAEVTASALRLKSHATLVGRRTYGKGLMQMITPVAGHLDLSLVHSTVELTQVNGEKIQGIGLAPDFDIPDDEGLADDPQLEYAILLLSR